MRGPDCGRETRTVDLLKVEKEKSVWVACGGSDISLESFDRFE